MLTTTSSNPFARTTGTAILVVALALALAAMWPQSVSTAHEAPIILIATPALPTLETRPTDAPPLTAAALAAPTVVLPEQPPLPTAPPQIVVEKQIIIQQVTAPPAPTEPPQPTATPPLMLAAPSGTILVIATPAAQQSNQEFVDSFAAPSRSATCAFVGCLRAAP